MPVGIGPWSSGSLGQSGQFSGEIVSIDDPLRRNRVQVRVFGYQDDKGTIPDDKLEWIHVAVGDSQLAGAGSTHMYYPGAKVLLQQIGTELSLIGALAGFDSDNRNSTSADPSGSGQAPDVPKQVQGQSQGGSLGGPGRVSPGQGKDVVNLGRDPQVDQKFQKPDERETYDYAKTTAPFDKGTRSKFPNMKSIGIDKLMRGSDVLDVIKGMDGNESGAIKQALDIIKNLRMNGFGTSKDVIGAGLLSQAAGQFVSDFGGAPVIDLGPLLHELAICARIMQGMNRDTLRALINDGSINRCITSLSPATLAVDQSVLTGMIQTESGAQLASGSFDLTAFAASLQDLFKTGVHQALASAISQLNQLAQQSGGTPDALVALFGDPASFVTLATDLTTIAAYAGIGQSAIAQAGLGAIGMVLSGGLSTAAQLASQGNSGGGSNPLSSITSLMNQFMGNPVAMSEMQSGQLNPQSLLQIPLKYVKKNTNDPKKMFASGGAGGLGNIGGLLSTIQSLFTGGSGSGGGGSPGSSTINLSGFSTVAISGSYTDLTDKPSFADVATSGAYSDLSGTPVLGTAAALNVGTGANNVVQLDNTGKLPAVDGSQLTGIVGVPTGTTILVNGTTAPTGFLKENGALVSRTTYAALWAYAQASGRVVTEAAWSAGDWGAFSSGDGSTTFRLPDGRGEFIRGLDDSRGVDSGRLLGASQTDAFQGHYHSSLVNGTVTPGDFAIGGMSSSAATVLNAGQVLSPASDGSHGTPRTASETRPRNVSKLPCIKY